MLYTLAASQELCFMSSRSLMILGTAILSASLSLLAPAPAQAVISPMQPPGGASPAIMDSGLHGVLAAAQQGYLGVHVRDVDAQHAQKQKLSVALGAEVVSLDHDAPAAKAGVHTGDIIQALNGQPVRDAATLSRLLRDMPVGKIIDLQIMHNGKLAQVHLQLGDRDALVQHAWAHHFRVPLPESAPIVQGFAAQHSFVGGDVPSAGDTPDAQAYVGAQVEPLTPQLAKYFGVGAGNGLLVRTVEDKSPASNAGMEAGDILLSADGQALQTTADWLQALRANAGHPVPITVLRNRKVLSLAITVDARITQSELITPEQLRRSVERFPQ
jgi:serine protease Do